ncbi:nucleotidyltransferase domain-containing protein [Patescibacteria group bacterium AH-259-L05]|nr:nucleotidyltransferase domain-containing protein [Patescibacteria group bacterium AH-259-L05]
MKSAEKTIKKIIFQFLDPKVHKVFIFGSRATGKAKKYSDYDIGIWSKKPIPSSTKILIEEALEESDLPYNVDIVDFSFVDKKFKDIALSKIKQL